MPEYFRSQRLPVTFVPPQTHRSNAAERAIRTGKNHIISILSSTHSDIPNDLWDRLLPYAEIILNVMRPWRPDPTLSAGFGLHCLPYDFFAHPIHPPGQLCLAFSGPEHHDTCAPRLTGIALAAVVGKGWAKGKSAESDLPPPPTPDPSSTRPSPTLDGTDLIGESSTTLTSVYAVSSR